jgi:hypothetical protein
MTRQDYINAYMAREKEPIVAYRSVVAPLTKLDALRILANAYWYLDNTMFFDSTAGEAFITLEHAFGYVRRSLRIHDLKPEGYDGLEIESIIVDEGYNGRGPTWL